jgi:hypothetical protein
MFADFLGCLPLGVAPPVHSPTQTPITELQQKSVIGFKEQLAHGRGLRLVCRDDGLGLSETTSCKKRFRGSARERLLQGRVDLRKLSTRMRQWGS